MRPSLLLALASVTLPACADDHHDADEPVNCELITADDDFVIGLTKLGILGKYNFELTSFSPAPPAVLLNEWTMKITAATADATPLAQTETLYMTPYMPKHGHGAGRDVEIAPMPTAGEFMFSAIDLHMPGLWEVTVEVEDPGSPGFDRVIFKPCLPN